MAKHSVLVADADPRSLRILEVALRKAGLAVGTASDGAEALRRIQRTPPDIVISEVQLPGTDGFTLCRSVRSDQRLSALPFVLMSADRNPAVKLRATEIGADDFLVKPLLIKELVTRVRMLLEQREQARLAQRGAPAGGMTGTLDDLGLVDLFQSLEGWRRSAVVHCEGDGRRARIWVREGQIIDAEVGPLVGEHAFYRLINWEHGSYRVEFGSADRDRRIEGGTAVLLHEGLRRLDEVSRAGERLPPSDVFAVDYPMLLQRLSDLPDEVNAVLRLFDGQRTVQQILESSAIDDLSTLAVIERLLGEGVLRRREAPQPAKKPSLVEWLGDKAPVSQPPPAREPEPEPEPLPEKPEPEPAPVVAAPAPAPALFGEEVSSTARFPLPASPRPAFEPDITDKVKVPIQAEPPTEPPPPAEAAAVPAPSPESKPAAPARASRPIERIIFPPLRGVRRERLRRESDEVRAAIGGGRPVRLVHALDLPSWPQSGQPRPGARRVSAAVSEEAKRLTPGEPLFIPYVRSVRAPPPAQPERPAEPQVAPPPPAPPPARPAIDDRSDAAIEAVRIAPEAVARASPADDFDDQVRAALGGGPRRWPLYLGAAAVVLIGIWFIAIRQPKTERKDAPWLESAPAAIKHPAPPPEPQKPAPAPATAPDPAPAARAEPSEPPPPPPPPKEEPREEPEPSGPQAVYARAMSSGEALLKRGKYRQAVGEFKKAVAARPASVPALLSLGDAYLESDQPRDALKPLDKAARLDPQNGRAQLLMGTAYQSLRRNKDAAGAYQKYLELEPSGEFARDVRSILANLKN